MIDVSELRIGNLVTTVKGTKHYGQELDVEFITNNNYDLDGPLDSINGYKESDVVPIPLSENWLKNFGFTKVEDEDELYFLGKFQIQLDIGFVDYGFSEVNGRPVETVHHLQNLFFILSGEELTLKQ